jgi:anionic cell wall polymer biosynthesis LytR-Cps2A-Psr (LCP) family protein
MRDSAAQAGATIAWQQGQDIAFVIQPGQRHMSGDWAMAYSRTRIYTTDFARQARQQDVLKALRTGLDPCSLVTRLPGLIGDVGYAFNTDLPLGNSSDLNAWAGLARNVTGPNVKSIVLQPTDIGMPFVAGYPAVDNASWIKIKNLVAHSLDTVPAATASGSTSGGGGFHC